MHPVLPACRAAVVRSALVLLVALAGCGGPPPPPPTVVNLVATTTNDANGSAPVSVRVYQLVSPAAFENAQFFQLFNSDQAVLKDDLVKRDDLLLPPGQSRTLTLTPPDRAKAVGVLVALRDYERATWRGVVGVPTNKTSAVTIGIGATGVTVTIEPVKP